MITFMLMMLIFLTIVFAVMVGVVLFIKLLMLGFDLLMKVLDWILDL